LDVDEVVEIVLEFLDFVFVNSDPECAISNSSGRVHHLSNSEPIQRIRLQRIEINHFYTRWLIIIASIRILTLNQIALQLLSRLQRQRIIIGNRSVLASDLVTCLLSSSQVPEENRVTGRPAGEIKIQGTTGISLG
jgi:hypothetical protein